MTSFDVLKKRLLDVDDVPSRRWAEQCLGADLSWLWQLIEAELHTG